ncbi:hypothetical protein NEOLI_002470 [Neolecta irregularis DAH-3]|uniref:Uncharacterized protein n=1 Tax=Neolecta irregularis (strain DAH-3) TaxID=1198029 RepID=A0A1U7LJ36_NEOID|nr:hypothetical protein NEOLI_002470 [Neolecta irregularis DAH-3]|eukprot:OLL22665.1 hypothetical protein NEOLI_002470 [Neolecta irregularis DAH-3]
MKRKRVPQNPSRSSSPSIGPSPPPENPVPGSKPRGRGAHFGEGGIKAMDDHFAHDYDPSKDVDRSETLDDWAMALDAMRDRDRWKEMGRQKPQDRDIGESNFPIYSKGTREWDRGKVVDNKSGECGLTIWGRTREL